MKVAVRLQFVLIGEYSKSGAKECEDCPAGTYNDLDGQGSCKICPNGTYNSGTKQTSCINCYKGSGVNKDQSSCNICSNGTYNDGPDVNICAECPPGTYSNSQNNTKCERCQLGNYGMNSGQTSANACFLCKEFKKVSDSSVCLPCPAGTCNDNTGKALEKSCAYCPAGTYDKTDMHNGCMICPVGTYSSNASASCIDCPRGTYNDKKGQKACKLCPMGMYANDTGSIMCFPCALGTYSNKEGAVSCSLCPAGTYTNITGTINCTYCSKGTYNPYEGNFTINACEPCPKGHYVNREGYNTYSSCRMGTYNNETGRESCDKCPIGTYNWIFGATSINDCLDVYNPSEGANICINCPINTYNDKNGSYSNESCIKCQNSESNYSTPVDEDYHDCPNGTYNNLTGQISLLACGSMIPGKFYRNYTSQCIECPAGTFNNETRKENCTICPTATYNDKVRATECTKCPVGYFSSKTGNVSPNQCNACLYGEYNDIPGSKSCAFCPIGTYNNRRGMEFKEDCMDCPNGTYSSDIGAKTCKNCPAGTYNPNERQTDCILCGVGTYSAKYGQDHCDLCPAGTFGDVVNGTECTNCPIGTYTNMPGQTYCNNCLPGTYSDMPGQTECTKCPNGTYGPSAGMIARSLCRSCPAGTFNPNTGSPSIDNCRKCSTGEYSNEMSSACTPCLIGTYNDEEGQESCKNCITGTYNNLTGQTKCYECNDGYYSTNITKEVCSKCHKLCKKCYGGSNYQCYMCWEDINKISPARKGVCNCIEGYFYDKNEANRESYCKPCQGFCGGCEYEPNHCTFCKENPGLMLISDRCTCSAPQYFLWFNSSTNEDDCISCNPLCNKCYGILSTECTSCNPEIGSIFRYPSSCVCPLGLFFDENSKKCAKCSVNCDECFGPSFQECYGCSSSMMYSVKSHKNWCVQDCNILEGYFREKNICVDCHTDCKTCVGSSLNNCTSCSNKFKFLAKYSCVNSCSEHYFEKQKICYECHNSCLNCTDFGNSLCESCIDKLYLYKGKCISYCPAGTYLDTTLNQCKFCVLPCKNCILSTQCTSCESLYCLFIDKCVLANECPSGTYGNLVTGMCEVCHSSCLTCIGSNKHQCASCNSSLEFMQIANGYGSCVLRICSTGWYLNGTHCAKCNLTCKSCDGPIECLECKKEAIAKVSNITGKLTCIKCPKGFEAEGGSKCREICGDGLNLGFLDCDDGNNIDGDGCSSTCNIEEGFTCTKESGKPDVCRDTTILCASIAISKVSSLIITFNKKVYSTISSDKLEDCIEIVLEGVESDPIKVSWNFSNSFNAFDQFNMITIQMDLPYAIAGGSEKFIVKFKNESLFRDKADNTLKLVDYSAPAMKQVYATLFITAAGTAFTVSTIGTFIFSVGLNPFKSAQSFWIFIDMLQIISYLPLIDCIVPENLRSFVVNYFGISKASIPFDDLPGWVPNPLTLLEKFKTKSIGKKLKESGYVSTNFIYNYSNQLCTIFAIFALYLVLCAIPPYISRKKYDFKTHDSLKFVKKLKNNYRYNSTLRIINESYLAMTFCSILNIYYFNFETIPNAISFWSSVFAIVFCIVYIYFIFTLIERPCKELNSQTFNSYYGTILENLKLEKSHTLIYCPLYLARRFTYSIVLVIFSSFPILQLILILFFNIVPMMIYIIICDPFESSLYGRINFYVESIFFFVFGFILVLNVVEVNSALIEVFGWVSLGLILVEFFITWTQMAPILILNIMHLSGRKNNQNPFEHTDQSEAKEAKKYKMTPLEKEINADFGIESKVIIDNSETSHTDKNWSDKLFTETEKKEEIDVTFGEDTFSENKNQRSENIKSSNETTENDNEDILVYNIFKIKSEINK